MRKPRGPAPAACVGGGETPSSFGVAPGQLCGEPSRLLSAGVWGSRERPPKPELSVMDSPVPAGRGPAAGVATCNLDELPDLSGPPCCVDRGGRED